MEAESGSRRLYLLWFFAAALAFAAVGIELYRFRTIDWIGAVLGAICVTMGVLRLRRESSRDTDAAR